jgi:hypothetical protein
MARTPRPWWSRPVHADACSMFARMPRDGPAPPGIRSAARMRATGQNGSSRHVLALFDSSSRRIIELSSGLLIRGFGVQVPGVVPVLTWGFIALGHFFMCPVCPDYLPVLAPCSLGGRMLTVGRLVKFRPIGLDQPPKPFRSTSRSVITAGMTPTSGVMPADGFRDSAVPDLPPPPGASGLSPLAPTVIRLRRLGI